MCNRIIKDLKSNSLIFNIFYSCHLPIVLALILQAVGYLARSGLTLWVIASNSHSVS